MCEQDCTNCKHCLMRRTDVWCELDRERKPTMSYTCGRYEQGAQWMLLDATRNAIRRQRDESM